MSEKIPGLISITETSSGFVFEIEDDKISEFYSAFGLEVGDSAGFQDVLNQAIENFLKSYEETKNEREE